MRLLIGFNRCLAMQVPLILVALTNVLALPDAPEAVLAPEHKQRIVETKEVARRLHESGRRLASCAESLPEVLNELGSGAATSCECLDIEGTDSSLVNCIDYCRLCRDELNLCVTYNYGYNFVNGEINTFLGRLVYDGRRADVLEFQENYGDTSTCSTSVNNVACNSCSFGTGDCDGQLIVDCSNIEPGVIINECTGGFETIPETSVFVAYNPNFFDDRDCVFFPTTSPIPTHTPFPSLPPTALPTRESDGEERTELPTSSPTRQPFITLNLNQFRIGVQYSDLNANAFVQSVLDYLIAELNSYFPDLVGVILNRVEPADGDLPPNEVVFVLDGEAIFLGTAPNETELEAAQRFILRDLVALQEAITSNPDVGFDVFVTFVSVVPDTPMPAPTRSPSPLRGKGKGKGNWAFKVSKSKKFKNKKGKKGKKDGGKMKSKKHMLKSKEKHKGSGSRYPPKNYMPSPTYHYTPSMWPKNPANNWKKAPTEPAATSWGKKGKKTFKGSDKSSVYSKFGGGMTWKHKMGKKKVFSDGTWKKRDISNRDGSAQGMFGSWTSAGAWSMMKKSSMNMKRGPRASKRPSWQNQMSLNVGHSNKMAWAMKKGDWFASQGHMMKSKNGDYVTTRNMDGYKRYSPMNGMKKWFRPNGRMMLMDSGSRKPKKVGGLW